MPSSYSIPRSWLLVGLISVCVISNFQSLVFYKKDQQSSWKNPTDDVDDGVDAAVACEHNVPPQETETVHMVYGLSGDDPGFLSEFEISLKSVLVNAPINYDITVHVITDQLAYEALPEVLNRTQITTWRTRNSITLQIYNIQAKIPIWEQYIHNVTKIPTANFINVHSIGCFFRLFVHDIIDSSIHHVLYMDTDIIVMARLDGIWKYADPLATFQWGEGQCAGFLLLTVPKLDSLWQLVRELDLKQAQIDFQHSFDDQLLFIALNRSHPEIVSLLPKEWDVTLTGLWRGPLKNHRPDGIGYMHLNGGGGSKESAFREDQPFLFSEKHKDGWGVGSYYVRLSWQWAKFYAESSSYGPANKELTIRFVVIDGAPEDKN